MSARKQRSGLPAGNSKKNGSLGTPERSGQSSSSEKTDSPVPASDAGAVVPASGAPFRPGRGGFGGMKLRTPKSAVRYTPKPIIPAEKAELISVAKAMHREDFGKNVKETFNPEVAAALRAVESGHYIGWRCPEYTWDCIRVGEESRCFCGHPLNQHRYFNGAKAQTSCAIHDCRCRSFAFVPSRPEDVGEFWLQKRPGYDPSTWKAKCRCKHAHTDHSPIGLRKCLAKQCRCYQFESDFLCAACDRHWEEHETFFETEDIRAANGLPVGEAYLPFAELPELRNMALTGEGSDDSKYLAVAGKQSPFALGQNLQRLSLRSPAQGTSSCINNNTPVPFGYHPPKGSPFDP